MAVLVPAGILPQGARPAKATWLTANLFEIANAGAAALEASHKTILAYPSVPSPILAAAMAAEV